MILEKFFFALELVKSCNTLILFKFGNAVNKRKGAHRANLKHNISRIATNDKPPLWP